MLGRDPFPVLQVSHYEVHKFVISRSWYKSGRQGEEPYEKGTDLRRVESLESLSSTVVTR